MFVIYLPFLNILTLAFLSAIWTSDTWADGLFRAWCVVLLIMHLAYVWPLLQTMVRF